MIQNPLRTPLKLHVPAFLACAAFSLLPLLPSRASALSLFAGLRLPSSPRALALFGLVCPPRFPLSWLVFVAPPPSWFGLFCWRGLFFVLLGLFGVSLCWLSLAGFSFLRLAFVGFASRHTGQVHSYIFAFTCTTKALIYHCTCVSVRRLDRFTWTVGFHRSTTS